MFADWTFGRRLGAGFTLACVALLVLAVIGYRSTQSLVDGSRWVSHTLEVRRQLAEVLLRVTRSEATQRAFLLTGDRTLLDPYKAEIAQLDEAYQQARTLTADNPEQQERLAKLRVLLDRRLGLMAASIDARTAGGVAAAPTTQEEMRTMDAIRDLLGEVDATEQRLLDARQTEAEASAVVTKMILLWGSVTIVALVAVIGWFITRSLTRQIGDAIQTIQSSSMELQAAATQQAASARHQATSMTEISTTVSELLATSRQIADTARRVGDIAEGTASTAQTGDTIVGRGNDSVAEIRRQVDAVVTGMTDLGKTSQQVGVVLDIVSELAEQTNILAINASIEAAGAGESGRRFGTVADEIRRLADRVGGSTKEIRTLIEGVRGAVQGTIASTEAGAKAVDAGSRQFAEVAAAFGNIVGSVTTTTEATREITLSTSQQATAVEQVAVAVRNVAQASQETEASTSQTASTASELAALSKNLLRLVVRAQA
jgi:methyl-accepting chemotaxis protein